MVYPFAGVVCMNPVRRRCTLNSDPLLVFNLVFRSDTAGWSRAGTGVVIDDGFADEAAAQAGLPRRTL